MGFTDNEGNVQFLQIHNNQHACRQIVTDGNDGAVKITDAQRPKHLFVLCVAHHSMGHIVGNLLHQIAAHIQRQHFTALLAELTGYFRAKPAKADHTIGFHGKPPNRSSDSSEHSGTGPLPYLPSGNQG